MFCPNPECPDLQETGSAGEYVDGVIECPVCGALLVSAPPDVQPSTEPLTSAEVVPVFETAEPAEAEVVKSILSGADIPFLVEGQDQMEAYRAGHAAFRFHPLGGAIRFMVPVDRAEEARILLSEVESASDDGE